MVANIYEAESRAAMKRMRNHFELDISGGDTTLGIRTTFLNGVTCKEAGPKKIEFKILATTDAVDSVREVVVRDGCDWKSYFGANNMTLFADHCYGSAYRVGYARDLPVPVNLPRGGKGWLLTGLVDRFSNIPTHQAIVAGLLDGRIGASIGFEALEWGDPTPEEQRQYIGAERMIRRCKILEVSLTYMPCNVECQTQSVTVDEGKAREFEALATKGLLPKLVCDHLLIPRTTKAATPPPEPPKRKRVIYVQA